MRPGRTVTGRPAVVGAVVEFAGLPGAGKSTLALHTQTALLRRDVACTISDAAVSASVGRPVRAARRAALASAEVLPRPAALTAALRALHDTHQESVADGLLGVLQWLAVQQLGARSRQRGGVHLLEEGQVQTLWTLALRSRLGERDAVSRLVAGLPAGYHPDLVVVVEAPVDQLSSRLSARVSKHSRTQALAEPARSEELRRGRLLLDEILAGAACAQLRLTNDDAVSPEDLGGRVADQVLGCLGSQGPAATWLRRA